MTTELWLLRQAPVTIAAVVEDGTIIDITRRNDDRPTITGSQFIGKIIEKNTKLKALFVDLGLARPGFLSLTKTTKELTVGQRISVTCTSELSDLKGPALRLDGALCDNEPKPSLTSDASDPVAALLERNSEVDNALCSDPALVEALRLKLPIGVKISAFAKSEFVDNWRDELSSFCDALDSFSWPLKEEQGVALLFEPGQTLTAIDVNSGAGAIRNEEERLQTNLNAAVAIVEQLKLRQLSGQIVVDFVGMERRESRQKVTAAVEQALSQVPNRVSIVPLNSLDLLCLSIQRLYPPFHVSSQE